MKEKILYIIWTCLYVICAGLGFVPEAEGAGKVLLVLSSLIFFLPGFVLLWHGYQSGNKTVMVRVRVISIVSLSLTLLLLILNFLSLNYSPRMGNVLYVILGVVSTPMLCSRYWVLSLFLWACLLMASFTKPGKKQ